MTEPFGDLEQKFWIFFHGKIWTSCWAGFFEGGSGNQANLDFLVQLFQLNSTEFDHVILGPVVQKPVSFNPKLNP